MEKISISQAIWHLKVIELCESQVGWSSTSGMTNTFHRMCARSLYIDFVASEGAWRKYNGVSRSSRNGQADG